MKFCSLSLVSMVAFSLGSTGALAATTTKPVVVKTASNTATMPKISSAASKAISGKDPLVEGAMQCTKYFPRYEREYAIPTHLLSAIASTESGRYHDGLKIRLPWPWTVMAGGVGKFYDTKEQAVAAVKGLKAKGVKNIDVGCMQVNLYHHGEAFANVEQAFEPEYNVNYAATFLRQLYNDDHSWKKAASDYHSKTPELGARYIGMVYDSWFTIIQKLRDARLAVPASSINGMAELKGQKPSKQQLATAKVEPYPAAQQPLKPVYSAPHMNSIKVQTVAAADTTPDAVAVVREPEPAPAPKRDEAPLMVNLAKPAPSSVNVAENGYVVTVNKNPEPLPPVGAVQPAQSISAQTLAPTEPSAPAPVVAAAVGTQPVSAVAPAKPSTVQSLALTQDGSKVNAAVVVPVSGITQAAVAPVTGLANSLAQDALDRAVKGPEGAQNAPSHTAEARIDNAIASQRRIDTAAVAYKSGPNFIFSE